MSRPSKPTTGLPGTRVASHTLFPEVEGYGPMREDGCDESGESCGGAGKEL